MNNYFITVIFESKINGHRDACFTSEAYTIEEARERVYNELKKHSINLINVRTVRVESLHEALYKAA